jgi:hypothetical protein
MAKLTRDQLIERVQRIIDVAGPDEELEQLAEEINASIPYPDILELIYDETESHTASEIVDRALHHKAEPIRLPATRSSGEKDAE